MSKIILKDPTEEQLFTEVKSPNQAWAFTYKVLGNTYTPDVYIPVISHLNDCGLVKHVVEERDSKGKLHIHGIVLLRKGFHRKRLIQKGFNCHLSEIQNDTAWINYCNKDQKRPYMFADTVPTGGGAAQAK